MIDKLDRRIEEHNAFAEKAAPLHARIAELEKAVTDAIDMVMVWGSYADDYAKNKHGFERDLAELQAVLNGRDQSRNERAQ